VTGGATLIFVGLDEAAFIAYFAIDLSPIGIAMPQKLQEIEQGVGFVFSFVFPSLLFFDNGVSVSPAGLEISGQALRSIRPTAFLMTSMAECAFISQARAILDWNRRNQFCAICGSKTAMGDAGYKRQCPTEDCLSNQGIQNVSYPRTDPVVIAVILSPDRHRCLLGRSKKFVIAFRFLLSPFVLIRSLLAPLCQAFLKAFIPALPDSWSPVRRSRKP